MSKRRGELEYVKLGRSYLKVSRICLGTWQWGSGEWDWSKDYGEKDTAKAL